jgi:hypothetical protein
MNKPALKKHVFYRFVLMKAMLFTPCQFHLAKLSFVKITPCAKVSEQNLTFKGAFNRQMRLWIF